MRKGWKRVHRLVVLPDYQGIGIGVTFLNHVAAMYDSKYGVNITTSTNALTEALVRSSKWSLIRRGRVNPDKKIKVSCNRITHSFNWKK